MRKRLRDTHERLDGRTNTPFLPNGAGRRGTRAPWTPWTPWAAGAAGGGAAGAPDAGGGGAPTGVSPGQHTSVASGRMPQAKKSPAAIAVNAPGGVTCDASRWGATQSAVASVRSAHTIWKVAVVRPPGPTATTEFALTAV